MGLDLKKEIIFLKKRVEKNKKLSNVDIFLESLLLSASCALAVKVFLQFKDFQRNLPVSFHSVGFFGAFLGSMVLNPIRIWFVKKKLERLNDS